MLKKIKRQDLQVGDYVTHTCAFLDEMSKVISIVEYFDEVEEESFKVAHLGNGHKFRLDNGKGINESKGSSIIECERGEI